MTLKKTSLMLSFAALASSSIVMCEARQSGTIVVTVNGQQLTQSSNLGKEINEKLLSEKEKLSKPLQDDEKKIMAKEQELQQKQKDLSKEAEEINKSSLLSQEAKQRKFEELEEKARRLTEDKAELERLIKRLQADAKRVEGKIGQMYQEEMGKFDSTIKTTIRTLSAKEGWDIVLMEESIVYAGPSVSKTEIVIKELNNNHASHKPSVKTLEKELKEDKKLLNKLEHARG